mmetsp:Transcript_46864/g.74843  ORF Transcript_46864/g.74843 Transcript_46864/m.74843 type:complete len:618 (-) Transcript_46864:74-1927(-)
MDESASEPFAAMDVEEPGRSQSHLRDTITGLPKRPNGIGSTKKAAIFVAVVFLLFMVVAMIVYIVQHSSKKMCLIDKCSEVVQPADGDCSKASCTKCTQNFQATRDGEGPYCAPICSIELCNNVSVPRGVHDCNDNKVTCAECATWAGQQTEAKQDTQGKYCALPCRIAHCKTVEVSRGKVEDCSSASVSCKEADEGYAPMRDDKGPFAGIKCDMTNCANYTITRNMTDCKDVACKACSAECMDVDNGATDLQGDNCRYYRSHPEHCGNGDSDKFQAHNMCCACGGGSSGREGSHFAIDNKWNIEPKCINRCSAVQIRAGCAAFYCSSPKSCSRCAPGFTSNGTACKKAGGPALMEFYMYRASKEMLTTRESLENINTASAAGVLWYLHNEVVRESCAAPAMERARNISRIQRFKVKVKNTQQVYHFQNARHLLGRYMHFDSGRCVTRDPDCKATWDTYGYHVGVQMTTFKPRSMGYPYYENRYSNALWYSLPGGCPEKKFDDPDKEECSRRQPGGACRNEHGHSLPTGTDTCTWQIVGDIREVTIDELTGITDYKAFCAAGKKEYDVATDRGEGFSWWDHREDDEANAERTRLLLAKFAEKYPDDPVLLDPIFDGM